MGHRRLRKTGVGPYYAVAAAAELHRKIEIDGATCPVLRQPSAGGGNEQHPRTAGVRSVR